MAFPKNKLIANRCTHGSLSRFYAKVKSGLLLKNNSDKQT